MKRLSILLVLLIATVSFALTEAVVTDMLYELYISRYTGLTEGDIFTSFGVTEPELDAYFDGLSQVEFDGIMEAVMGRYEAFLDARMSENYDKPPAMFEGEMLGSGVFNLEDNLGDGVLFINVFATWCAPCKSEIPHFSELIEEFDGKFNVVGISTDNFGDIESIAGFAGDMGIEYPLVLFAKFPEEVMDYYESDAVPTTWVVGPDGLVQKIIVGSRSKEDFHALISDLLEG